MVIFYLHGFNSAANDNEKSNFFKRYGKVISLEYDTFSNRDDIIKNLIEQVEREDLDFFEDSPIFVGTSLGGYYASILGKHFSRPSILINPATNPHDTIMEYVGVEMVNYVNGEVKTITPEVMSSYVDGEIPKTVEGYSYIPLMILASKDEVLDNNKTFSEYGEYDCFMFEGGDHRFSNIGNVEKPITSYVNICGFVSDCNS